MPVLLFFVWLALLLGAGWLAFPLSRRVFGAALPDAGLSVGRILFLGIWTLLAFWLGQIGVPVKASALLYSVLALVSIAYWWRHQSELGQIVRGHKRAMVATEAIFVAVFLGFFLLRGFWSDTNGTNGEKSMDSALIGSLVRAQRLPPPNPYAAGAPLRSYYYFGHLETALLTGASGGQVRWTYNLMCATLPALCFSALFGLGGALTGRLRGGAFVAGAVLAGGTLQPIYQWTHQDPYSATRFLHLDPFAVSRVLPYSINEFPWFTFNQADLHGHYFDFPFQIALMALAWSLYRAKRPRVALLATLILGAQIITNTWDFPVYALLVGFSMVIAGEKPSSENNRRARPILLWLTALMVVLGALVVASPFLIGVKSAATPPRLLPQPASPLREWLLLWGPMTLAWWTFSAYATFCRDKLWRLALLVLGVGALVSAYFSDWQVPSSLVLPLLAASVGLALAGLLENRGALRFVCLLGLCGLLAIVWSETTWAGFLGDPNHVGFDDFKRQDTAFKFGLQGWMLWGTASAAGVWIVIARGARWLQNVAFAVGLALLVVMWTGNLSFMLYRIRLNDTVAAHARGEANWFKFDGWDSWAHLAPPEKSAAAWLLDNAAPGENIVEAELKAGGDYTEFTRYAHATGIPTVIGPQAHSFQWSPANAPMGRGETARAAKAGAEWNEVFRRKADARAIYSPVSAEQRRELMDRYGVKYLLWGELERREYGEAIGPELERDLAVAARFGANDDPHRVVIFRVK